jgi:endonuclease YncB( thermonuclease family)
MARSWGPYTATIAAWHDGDTCAMDVELGFGLVLGLSCRVYGINAPELATAAGLSARDYARQLALPGSQVQVLSHGWDKYGGRFLGEITLASGAPFADAMIAAGHALAYFGKGPKPV